MSKLTTRDYKNMAKRPSKRGHGRAVLRDVPEVEEVTVDEALDIVDEAEMDLAELVDGEAEVEVAPDLVETEVSDGQDEAPPVAGWDDDSAEAAPVGKVYENPQTLGSIDKGNAL